MYEKALPEIIATEICRGSVHWSKERVAVRESKVHFIPAEHCDGSYTLQYGYEEIAVASEGHCPVALPNDSSATYIGASSGETQHEATYTYMEKSI